MTTQVTTIGTVGTMGPARRPSLEELVDRLIAAMFPQEEETTETVARSGCGRPATWTGRWRSSPVRTRGRRRRSRAAARTPSGSIW